MAELDEKKRLKELKAIGMLETTSKLIQSFKCFKSFTAT
jgi:hypothetical protein